MMRKKVLTSGWYWKVLMGLWALPLLMVHSLWSQNTRTYHLPKALILTTGSDDGRGTVSDGIVLALQALNRQGVRVRLDNREILLDPERLRQYDWIFLPTISGYHDLPRPRALTYLSDQELENLARWIHHGGWLITDTHAGRNLPDGTDRLTLHQPLDESVWPLASAFGATLTEKNITGWKLSPTAGSPWQRPVMIDKVQWLLVPEHLDSSARIWMYWQHDSLEIPAAWTASYGKGRTVVLPYYALLHPVRDDGLSTPQEIQAFYDWLYRQYVRTEKPVQLSPWKDGYDAAYCQTFDDGGTPEQYRRVFRFIDTFQLPTVFFVTPSVPDEIEKELLAHPLISVEGHSWSHPDFRTLDFYETYSELARNRLYWGKNFTGFRFPYVSNSFWGMYWLDRLGYQYDSSIAAVIDEFIRGSAVPYNIPIFKGDFFLTLDLLEISQIYRSDWYFYQAVLEDEPYTTEQQQADAKRFGTFLKRHFDSLTAPNRGVMVFLGHPMYAGISEITMQPLYDLVEYLKGKNVWLASLNEVAHRWNDLQKVEGIISENGSTITIDLRTPGRPVEGLSLRLPGPPHKIKGNTAWKLKETAQHTWYLIFDLNHQARFKLKYK